MQGAAADRTTGEVRHGQRLQAHDTVTGVGAVALGNGSCGVALHQGRGWPFSDEANQRADEVGTVRAGGRTRFG